MPAPDLRSDETKERDEERHAFAARAVAEERERCAKIAEFTQNHHGNGYEIARLIRANAKSP